MLTKYPARHELLGESAFQLVEISGTEEQAQRETEQLKQLYEGNPPTSNYDVTTDSSLYTQQLQRLYTKFSGFIQSHTHLSRNEKGGYISSLHTLCMQLISPYNFYQMNNVFYLDIKSLLERIFLKLQGKTPQDQRNILTQLMPQLLVCPTGLLTTFNEILYRLSSQKILAEALLEYRLNKVTLAAERFIQKQGIATIYSIHVHAFFRRYAHEIGGFQLPLDASLGRHTDQHASEARLGITAEIYDSLNKALKTSYSPAKVIQTVINFFQCELKPFSTPCVYSPEVINQIEDIVKPLRDAGLISSISDLLSYKETETGTESTVVIFINPEFLEQIPALSREFCIRQGLIKSYEDVIRNIALTEEISLELLLVFPEKRQEILELYKSLISIGSFNMDTLLSTVPPQALWDVLGESGITELLESPCLQPDKARLAAKIFYLLGCYASLEDNTLIALLEKFQNLCGVSLANYYDSDHQITLLQVAVTRQRENLIKALIDKGADINADRLYGTTLMFAIETRNPGIVNLILKYNPAEIRDPFKVKLLIIRAIQLGSEEIVKCLIERTPESIEQNVVANGLLLAAIDSGHVGIINLLLKSGIKPQIHHLIQALFKNQEEIVRVLLASGAPVVSQEEGYSQPLTIAVDQGNKRLVELILDKLVETYPLEYSDSIVQAWLVAAIEGKLEIMQALHPYIPNVNTAGFLPSYPEIILERWNLPNTSYTALQLAYLTDQETIYSWLHIQGAEPSAPNQAGETLLHLAVKAENVQLLTDSLSQELVEPAATTHTGRTLLHYAIETGNPIILEEIIDKQPGLIDLSGAEGETPLHLATLLGNIDAMKKLMEAGAKQTALPNGFTALHIAVAKGDETAVRCLLRHGVPPDINIDRQKSTPLHVAIEEGHIKIAKLLIKAGADPRRQALGGMNAVHLAAQHNHAEILDMLAEDKTIDLTAQTEEGWTALHLAAYYKADAALEGLLDKLVGKDALNQQSSEGFTALHLSICRGYTWIAQRLIKKGVATDIPGPENNTPLHYAIFHEQTEIVKQLLDQKSTSVNAVNMQGATPLHLAVERNNIQLVELLLEKKSDKTIRNRQGDTLLHLAVLYGSVALIASLVLSMPEQLHMKNLYGETPLQLASSLNREDASAYLRITIQQRAAEQLVQPGVAGTAGSTDSTLEDEKSVSVVGAQTQQRQSHMRGTGFFGERKRRREATIDVHEHETSESANKRTRTNFYR